METVMRIVDSAAFAFAIILGIVIYIMVWRANNSRDRGPVSLTLPENPSSGRNPFAPPAGDQKSETTRIETTRIKYELGNLDGPGCFVGLLCDAQVDFDKDTGEWVLTGEGATGCGETREIASLLWIADRLKIQLPNSFANPAETDCPVHGKCGGEDGECPRC